MKNIIFIAPPAAGKGVQSLLLKEKYHVPHISTGDLLRNEVNSGSALGIKVNEIMKSGNLVDDEIITELLEKRLQENDTANGYILDGYPRTLEQAIKYEELLNRLHKELGVVIFLDIEESLALKRIVGRMSCPICGSSYNKYFPNLQPKNRDICDHCQAKLVIREDDNETSFHHRFETYVSKTAPLLQYYKDKNALFTIPIKEDSEPLDIFKKIEQVIN